MEAKELRLGIYVYSELFEDFTIVDREFLCTHSEQVKFWGIPITEEWLLKLGWQLDFYSNEYRGNNMIFYNHKNYVSYGMTKLYYVHQLQNLYFALTGEELQIIN